MRRRNKPRVVWLPQTNANSIGATGVLTDTVYQLFTFSVTGATGTTETIEFPMVLDSQVAIEDTGATLADIESSGYRLRRIVGKIWCQAGQTEPTISLTQITPLSVIVTAGIMVRLADTITGASISGQSRNTSINPGLIENTGDPWVFRRSWIIGNNNASDNLTTNQTQAGQLSRFFQPLNPVPANNYSVLAGGVSDGPHIDQKTARIVGPEHRLFLDVSVTILGESSAPEAEVPLTVAVFTDLRVLGSLKTNIGNRRNASR